MHVRGGHVSADDRQAALRRDVFGHPAANCPGISGVRTGTHEFNEVTVFVDKVQLQLKLSWWSGLSGGQVGQLVSLNCVALAVDNPGQGGPAMFIGIEFFDI